MEIRDQEQMFQSNYLKTFQYLKHSYEKHHSFIPLISIKIPLKIPPPSTFIKKEIKNKTENVQ